MELCLRFETWPARPWTATSYPQRARLGKDTGDSGAATATSRHVRTLAADTKRYVGLVNSRGGTPTWSLPPPLVLEREPEVLERLGIQPKHVPRQLGKTVRKTMQFLRSLPVDTFEYRPGESIRATHDACGYGDASQRKTSKHRECG